MKELNDILKDKLYDYSMDVDVELWGGVVDSVNKHFRVAKLVKASVWIASSAAAMTTTFFAITYNNKIQTFTDNNPVSIELPVESETETLIAKEDSLPNNNKSSFIIPEQKKGTVFDKSTIGGISDVATVSDNNNKQIGKESDVIDSSAVFHGYGVRSNGRYKKSSASSISSQKSLSLAFHSSGIASSHISPITNYNFSQPSITEVDFDGITGKEYMQSVELDHKIALSLGFSVRKMVTPRLGIETGLSYTKLTSSAKLNANYQYSLKQEVNYIGIPIGVSYDFISNKTIDLYGIASAAAEFGVGAEQKITFISDYRPYTTTHKLKTKGPVISFGTAVGFNYNIGNIISIYAEPGLSYYIENKRHPETYRSKKPLIFDMKFGIRKKI